MTGAEFPDYPADALDPTERAKAVLDARLDDIAAERKAVREAGIATDKAESDTYHTWATDNRNADIANLDKFQTALYTLSTGSLDRARAGAEMVQKASAAIATLYTGVLALVFSVTDHPLPARGILAPLFLGLAVVLSTAYVAYLRPTSGYTPGPEPALGLEPKSFQRLNALIKTANDIAGRRSGALRAGVVALGVGLVFMVAPFISLSQGGHDPAALPDRPAYPQPVPGATSELDKIRYQAQVDEVKQARAQVSGRAGTDDQRYADLTFLAVGLVVGVAAVVAVPHLTKGRDPLT